jgi:hypothetical protein
MSILAHQRNCAIVKYGNDDGATGVMHYLALIDCVAFANSIDAYAENPPAETFEAI